MTNVYFAPGGGRVATIAPGPDDLFVVTTIAGRKVLLQPLHQYQRALEVAQAFVKAQAPTPVTVKVFALSAAEAQAMGFLPADLLQGQTPEQEAKDRQLVVSTLWNVVMKSNEAKPREDAMRRLRNLGEVK